MSLINGMHNKWTIIAVWSEIVCIWCKTVKLFTIKQSPPPRYLMQVIEHCMQITLDSSNNLSNDTGYEFDIALLR